MRTASTTQGNGASGVPFDLTGSAEGDDIATATSGAFELSEDGTFRFVSTDAAQTPLMVRGAASQSADLTEWQNSAGTALASVDASGRIRAAAGTAALPGLSVGESDEGFFRNLPNSIQAVVASGSVAATFQSAAGTLQLVIGDWLKWSSREQTTVGAAGVADALPANPTKYLMVKDSAGTTLVIPAYAAS